MSEQTKEPTKKETGSPKGRKEVKRGLPPGTLIHVGKKLTDSPLLTLIQYNADHFSSELYKDSAVLDLPFKNSMNSWLNLDGLHHINHISTICDTLMVHKLTQEDILNTLQRPKVELVDGHLYLSCKMLGVSQDGQKVNSEQISLLLGKSHLLSFQERPGDIFGLLRERLEQGIPAIRNSGSDYLFYRLIDTVVDYYFYVVDHFNGKLEHLENRILNESGVNVMADIQKLKRQIISFRRAVYPMRECLLFLDREDTNLLTTNTKRHLRDVYDHIIQIFENIETQREMVSDLMNLYHTQVSNKMNSIMQLLTLITTIFVPLTFIAGIYGMNFSHMPELGYKYGYFIALGAMLVCAVLMWRWFKKKGWFN